MFGYVTPDKPNMYMKDYVLFRAYYCGLCHSMKKEAGQLARLTVNYDIAFIAAFFHDLTGEKREIVRKGCVLNPKKRPVIADTPLMREIARLNLLLAGLKIADDKADGEGKLLRRIALARPVKKAKKRSPELASLTEDCLKRQIAQRY